MFDLDTDRLREILNGLIRIGEVSSVDYATGTARVAFDDDDSLVSGDLQVLHRNTIANKDFAMPDVGEDVVCLFLASGMEEGFILGSVYAGEILPPETSGNKRTTVFSDGTRISYDRETRQLDITIDKTTISANTESVSVSTPVSVNITGGQTVNVKGAESVNVNTDGAVNVNGAGSVKITSPTITLEGNVEIKGEVNVNGGVTTTGDVLSGGKSLQLHTHTGNLGAPTSSPL